MTFSFTYTTYTSRWNQFVVRLTDCESLFVLVFAVIFKNLLIQSLPNLAINVPLKGEGTGNEKLTVKTVKMLCFSRKKKDFPLQLSLYMIIMISNGTWHKAFWVMGIQICSNDGPHPFLRGIKRKKWTYIDVV